MNKKSPTICLEHRWIHFNKNSKILPNDFEPYVIKNGKDLTIVACGYDVVLSLMVAKLWRCLIYQLKWLIFSV